MLEIRTGDLEDPEVVAMLDEHLREMHRVSRPESCHVLQLGELKHPEVSFWAAYLFGKIAACAALKQIDSEHGEVKSMRTKLEFRGQGLGKRMLNHVVAEARSRGYRRLSLETGSMDFFAPARKLYCDYGFTECEPFDQYVEDPESVFMTLEL